LGQYSANQAANQGMFGGLGSIMGGVGAMAQGGMFASDRRLKKNVQKIGKMCGLNVYKFDYIWDEPSIGFMADEVKEVMPEAVMTHESGYDMVNYNMVLGAS